MPSRPQRGHSLCHLCQPCTPCHPGPHGCIHAARLVGAQTGPPRPRGQSPSAALEQTGWARSVADVEIHELPSARDRSYVVPESDFALVLRCGREAANVPIKMAVKLGITEKEIDTLGTAILKALKTGAQDPTTIREAIGGASRSLGPEGIRKGMTTTLPLGLGLLQATGQIRRVPVNGRLDQQRYKYTLWNLPPVKLTDSEIYTQLARKFFSWIGPAQLSEFQWFSGLASKQRKRPSRHSISQNSTMAIC